MPSKIQVDQIAGATGSTVTLPSGQTLDLSSGTVNLPSASLSALNATNLTSGTVPSARLSLTSSDLPTVPTTKGGTGLTTLGTANQVLKMNSGATALEFGTASAGKLLGTARSLYTTRTTISGVGATLVHNSFSYPENSNIYMEVSYTKQSATSFLIVSGHGVYKFSTNTHGFAIWETSDVTTLKDLKLDEHQGFREYFANSFQTIFTGMSAGSKTFRASVGFQGTRSSTGIRNPNLFSDASKTDTPNADANSSFIMVTEIEI